MAAKLNTAPPRGTLRPIALSTLIGLLARGIAFETV